MEKILIAFILLLISGCENISFFKNQTVVDGCPQQPPSTSKAEEIDLNSSPPSQVVRLKAGEVKAYKFQGKSGKIFEHDYDKNICFWVYDPKSDLVNLDDNVELTIDGNYLVLMSIPEGVTTVKLEMSLKDKPKPEKTPEKPPEKPPEKSPEKPPEQLPARAPEKPPEKSSEQPPEPSKAPDAPEKIPEPPGVGN